nr:hypothetical protein [Candidatus Sigynarchaeota archaeon]
GLATAPAVDVAAPADVPSPAGDAAQGQVAPAPDGNPAEVQAPVEPAQAPASDAQAPEASTPAVEVVAPPAPKYVTVERTRVEYEKIHEQVWNFVGYSSNVTSAVADLAGKGGYVSENVLEKKFGKLTFLCPFEVDFPIGGIVSQYIKRIGPNAGLIYYPQSAPSPQSNAILTQLLQQFFASSAPRGHVIVYLKVNKSEASDEKVSIIVGGLTEQEGKIQQNLSKKLGNVFFDNNIFYKGQLLDDVKSIAGKLGLKLVTLVCTSNVIQSQDKLQNLVESF